MALTINQCKKADTIYSCDPDINEWVIVNYSSIQKMDRYALLELEPERLRPAYRALTPEQKYNCWMNKMEQVKSLRWTQNEFAHICFLEESVEVEWFDPNFNSEVLDDFILDWVTYGINNFGWTGYEVGCMIQTVHDVIMQESNVSLRLPPGGGNPPKDCHCSQKAWNDFCPTNTDGCAGGSGCNGSDHGCGWFWMKACTGRCGI